MSFMFIAIIVIAWILISGVALVAVCMMSSQANRTELLTEDKLPRRFVREDGAAGQETLAQPTVKTPTW